MNAAILSTSRFSSLAPIGGKGWGEGAGRLRIGGVVPPSSHQHPASGIQSS